MYFKYFKYLITISALLLLCSCLNNPDKSGSATSSAKTNNTVFLSAHYENTKATDSDNETIPPEKSQNLDETPLYATFDSACDYTDFLPYTSPLPSISNKVDSTSNNESTYSPTALTSTPEPVSKEFILNGNPEAVSGCSWEYIETGGDIDYQLTGFLAKPAGNGPFPAIIVSHGKGGSAYNYSKNFGLKALSWGCVVIAVNYTHAGENYGAGEPGEVKPETFGANEANLLRARKLFDILNDLGYVDMKRIAAHGHSMGAFVTAALAGTYSDLLLVASHTAGGVAPVSDRPEIMIAATKHLQAEGIRIPYQIHHGTADPVVNIKLDNILTEILKKNSVEYELIEYPGMAHNIGSNPDMMEKVRLWYEKHGLFRED